MEQNAYQAQYTAFAALTEQRLGELSARYLPAASRIGQAAQYSLLGGGKREPAQQAQPTSPQPAPHPPTHQADQHHATARATEAQLLELHAHKTGALIAAGVELGCDAADAPESTRAALIRYARELGLVFQIVDDILDVTSTTEQLGKPVGSDAANEKTTFITLYGLEGARRLAADHNEAALAALAPLGEPAEFLREMARELLQRDK